MTPPPTHGGDCSWCFLGTVHLVLQEKQRAAAGTSSISIGWPRKHIAIFATQIVTCNESVHNKCRCQWCFVDTTDNTSTIKHKHGSDTWKTYSRNTCHNHNTKISFDYYISHKFFTSMCVFMNGSYSKINIKTVTKSNLILSTIQQNRKRLLPEIERIEIDRQ